jgi:hypothetical protein
MIRGRSAAVAVLGIATVVSTLQAQSRLQAGAADAVAVRLFVEFVLDQAGQRTTGIPALRSDLPADLKLGIALRADPELLESRIAAFTTRMKIASAAIKNGGEPVAVWLRSRAGASSQVTRMEAENEDAVNKGFTSEFAAGATQAQSRIRPTIGAELAALERDFRSAVSAALTKDPALAVLATSDGANQELAASRAHVKRLLQAAGAK